MSIITIFTFAYFLGIFLTLCDKRIMKEFEDTPILIMITGLALVNITLLITAVWVAYLLYSIGRQIQHRVEVAIVLWKLKRFCKKRGIKLP